MPEPPPARSFPRLAASVAAAVAAAAALRCRADGAAIFTGRSSYAAPARVYFTAAAADRGADGALRPHSGTVRAVLKDPSRRIAGDYSFSANSLGAVSGSFALPPDAAPGAYSIELPRWGVSHAVHVVAPGAPCGGSAPPPASGGLSVSVDVPSMSIAPGGKVSWRVRAAPADGSAPRETQFAASLCETDASGRELPGGELAFFVSRRRAAPGGTFDLSFDAPAKRTFWRLSVFAHDAALRTGTASCAGISTLPPLSIHAAPPPFLRCGDEAYVPAAVANNTPAMAVAGVSVSISPDKVVPLEIPPSSNAVARILVKAPESGGVLKAVFSATLRDGETAAAETFIPVLPAAPRKAPPAPPSAKRPASPEWQAIAALERLSHGGTNCIDTLSARLLAFNVASHFAGTDPAMRQMFDSWGRLPDASGARRRLAAFFDAQTIAAETESAEKALAGARLPSGLWPWIRGGGPDIAVSLAVFGHAAASLGTAGRLPGIPLDGLVALDEIFAADPLPPEAAALAPEYVRIRSALAGTVPLSPRHQSAFAILAGACAAEKHRGPAMTLSSLLPCEKTLADACRILEGASMLPAPPQDLPDAPAPRESFGQDGSFSAACFMARAEGGFATAKIAIEAERPLERVRLRYERAANETPDGEGGMRTSGGMEYSVIHEKSADVVCIPRLPAGAHTIELRFRITAEGRFAPGWLAPADAPQPPCPAVECRLSAVECR